MDGGSHVAGAGARAPSLGANFCHLQAGVHIIDGRLAGDEAVEVLLHQRLQLAAALAAGRPQSFPPSFQLLQRRLLRE